MKHCIRLVLFAALAFSFHPGWSQTSSSPATKPTDATGLCKDGSYTTAANKSGACHGHHGIKEWYGVPPAATAPPATPQTDTATPPTPPPVAKAPSPTTQARTQSQAAAKSAGQSAEPPPTESIGKTGYPSSSAENTQEKVWLNPKSNVYHCPGSRYYGKTRTGAYMSESEAKAKGAHPYRGKACFQ